MEIIYGTNTIIIGLVVTHQPYNFWFLIFSLISNWLSSLSFHRNVIQLLLYLSLYGNYNDVVVNLRFQGKKIGLTESELFALVLQLSNFISCSAVTHQTINILAAIIMSFDRRSFTCSRAWSKQLSICADAFPSESLQLTRERIVTYLWRHHDMRRE